MIKINQIIFVISITIVSISAQGNAVGTRFDLTNSLQLNRGVSGQFAQLFIPDYYAPPIDGKFTLVFHLHSASWAAEDQVYVAGVNAILFNIQLGAFSSPYQNYFCSQGRYSAILDTITNTLQKQNIINAPRIEQIIMTAFSAGYAGIREVLKTPSYYTGISAINLADGLHCNSDSPVRDIQMQDFLRFARDARAGKKIMLITHSSILTTGYENTTQTTDYLINRLGATRRPDTTVDEIGTSYSSCDTGRFNLKGYLGQTAGDHLAHLHGMHLLLSEANALLDSGNPENNTKPVIR